MVQRLLLQWSQEPLPAAACPAWMGGSSKVAACRHPCDTGVSQIMGTFLGVPIIRTIVYLGLYHVKSTQFPATTGHEIENRMSVTTAVVSAQTLAPQNLSNRGLTRQELPCWWPCCFCSPRHLDKKSLLVAPQSLLSRVMPGICRADTILRERFQRRLRQYENEKMRPKTVQSFSESYELPIH